MAKNGPAELKRYHEERLAKENGMATATGGKSTEFDPATMNDATERVAAILAPNGAAAPATTSKRAPRSDRGKKRAQPKPGMLTLKLEMEVSGATDLLGYMLRTGQTGIAHQLVDAIARAQRAAD